MSAAATRVRGPHPGRAAPRPAWRVRSQRTGGSPERAPAAAAGAHELRIEFLCLYRHMRASGHTQKSMQQEALRTSSFSPATRCHEVACCMHSKAANQGHAVSGERWKWGPGVSMGHAWCACQGKCMAMGLTHLPGSIADGSADGTADGRPHDCHTVRLKRHRAPRASRFLAAS